MSQSRKIILVDDKAVFRKAMRDRLSRIGNVEIIGEAADGFEFLDLLKTKKPDLVFMDIEMPKMNGIEATKRAIEKDSKLVIIGLSMYDNPSYVDELINAGARGYLLKLSNNTKVLKTILEFPKSAEIFFSAELEKTKKQAGSSKKTILVVDDFEANTFAIGFTLTKAGYNVLKAHSGAEALKVAEKSPFDLLVTDYRMPEMNGAELIAELKKKPRYRNIPVLVLTTEKGQREKDKANRVGITGWIEKPFEIKRFLTLVEKALK